MTPATPLPAFQRLKALSHRHPERGGLDDDLLALLQRLVSLRAHTDTTGLGHLAARRVLTTSQLARLRQRPQRTVE